MCPCHLRGGVSRRSKRFVIKGTAPRPRIASRSPQRLPHSPCSLPMTVGVICETADGER
jgi:hypothetical protein